MKLSAKGWIAGCTFALLGALALPSTASAECGTICVRVSINPFCRQCVPTDLPGVGCIQSQTSPCSCFDEPNCPSPLALNPADEQLKTLVAIFAPVYETAPVVAE